MELDLRFNSEIDKILNKEFNEVSSNCRHEFNDFISSVSEGFEGNIDWWVSSAPSRNTYASPLFHYFCSIKFLSKTLDENSYKISVILVDSKELKLLISKILLKNSQKNIKILYKPAAFVYLKRVMKKLFYYELNYLYRLIRLLAANLIKFFIPISIPLKPIALIDTFIYKEYLNVDRWYGVLWDKLNEQQREDIFFVPSIINTGLIGVFPLLYSIKKLEKNTILKDDYINIRDINFAYFHKYRLNKLNINASYLGMDLSKLVKEDITNFRDVDSIFESLITFRFMYQLKRRGVKIRLAYDWFEGHSLDKAWNLGLKIFHQKTKRVGYRAFFKGYPYYLSTYPIRAESLAGVLPDLFAVPGKGSLEDVREFYPSLKAEVIPSFKASYIWEWVYRDKLDRAILVTLPISIKTSARIIINLIEASNLMSEDNSFIAFVLKAHPTIKIKDIKKELKIDIPINFTFTEENSFPVMLLQCSILITEASSTSLEALACGISVVIIENENGLTYDSIPSDVPQNMYKKVKGPSQIHSAIEGFIAASIEDQVQQNKLAQIIRDRYFEPVSEEGLSNFLNLEKNIKEI